MISSFTQNTLQAQRLRALFTTQRFDNGLRQVLVDLSMTRNCLELAGLVVRVPVVFPAVTDQFAPELIKLSDEVVALHAVTTNSSTFLTYGSSPEVRSR
jgi:hypothetical protein